MLKRPVTYLTTAALTITALAAGTTPANAAPAPAAGGASCVDIICGVWADAPATGASDGHSSSGGAVSAAKPASDNKGKGKSKGSRTPGPFECRDSDSKKDCANRKASKVSYDATVGCSWRLQSPQDAPPAGKSATEGAWYECVPPTFGAIREGGGEVGSVIRTEWRSTPPRGVTKISPGQAAKRVVESMQFEPVDIGVSPEVLGADKWYVGMPMWLWAKNKGQANVTGPMTKSASEGGVSVRATAKLASITYRMGDGGKVICTGGGTPYTASKGKQPSPTCDYRYSKMSPNEGQGTYEITATSKWNVSWTADGQSGQMPMQVSSTTSVRVGEIQTLNVPSH